MLLLEPRCQRAEELSGLPKIPIAKTRAFFHAARQSISPLQQWAQDTNPSEPSTSSSSLAEPPQSSLYIDHPKTRNTVTASAGEQLSTVQAVVTGTAYACKL